MSKEAIFDFLEKLRDNLNKHHSYGLEIVLDKVAGEVKSRDGKFFDGTLFSYDLYSSRVVTPYKSKSKDVYRQPPVR